MEELLLLYERISVRNRWDPTVMQVKVIFCLKDAAQRASRTQTPTESYTFRTSSRFAESCPGHA